MQHYLRWLSRWVWVWLVALAYPGYAQQTSVPMLKQQLVQATTDTVRSRLLAELGRIYVNERNDSCLYWLKQSYQLAQRSRNPQALARSMYQLGYAQLYYAKNEGLAANWLRKTIALASANRDYLHLAHSYVLLAVVARHQHIGDQDELVAKSLDYARKSGNWKAIVDACGIQHDLLKATGRYDYPHVAPILQEAMDACKPHDPDKWLTLGLDYCALLQETGSPKEAHAFARQLAFQTHLLRKRYGEFVYTNDIAHLLQVLGKYGQAERILTQALAQEARQTKPDTIHLYYYRATLLDIYEQQEAWQKALQQSKTLTDLRLWLQRKRQTRDAKLQMTEQKAAFDLEKKENEIYQQRIYLITSLIGAILLLGIMLLLYLSRRRIAHQKTKLTQLDTDLAQLNSTKNKLFAMLSHDLRTPVAHLRSYLMLHDWGALTKTEFDQSARTLSERLGLVQQLLDNMLNWVLSQMSGFRAHPQATAAYTLIQTELKLLSSQAEQKKITIYHDLPPDLWLMVDPNHLSVIVRNLLQNAIKFTLPGGTISLRFQMTDSQRPQLLVSDTGIGIPADKLTVLFQPYQKLSRNGTANETGIGLGLVVVHELIESNGGQVRVESQPGKGTTFTLTFTSLRTPINQLIVEASL